MALKLSVRDLSGNLMKANEISGVLFDLDGVLIDTEGIYTGIWEEIESHYPTGIPDFALVIKGNTLPRILQTYFEPGYHQSIISMLKKHEDEMDYPVFDGVLDFLHQLGNAGIPCAIVTSSSDRKMELIRNRIPDLISCFDAVITDSKVEHSKPHPDPYLKGAEALGVDPRKCIVFEDSYSGLQAGRAAGAKVVALATTNPYDTLVDKADSVIYGFDGIILEDLIAAL